MLKLKHLLLLLAITTLAGCGGGKTAVTPAPEPKPEPPGLLLSVSPTSGYTYANVPSVRIVISWATERATRVVSTSGFDAGGLLNGRVVYYVTRSQSFSMTVEGPGGQVTDTAGVHITQR